MEHYRKCNGVTSDKKRKVFKIEIKRTSAEKGTIFMIWSREENTT